MSCELSITTVHPHYMHCYYFTSAAVTADSSHMTASSSVSWNRFSPLSHSVDGHVSTMWFMVCRWQQSQEGDWARARLCKLARHGPMWKDLISNTVTMQTRHANRATTSTPDKHTESQHAGRLARGRHRLL